MSQESNWYVVLDGEQSGPHERAYLVELLEAGTISGASFAWHAGMDDWQPLEALGEFDDVLAGLSVSPANADTLPVDATGGDLGEVVELEENEGAVDEFFDAMSSGVTSGHAGSDDKGDEEPEAPSASGAGSLFGDDVPEPADSEESSDDLFAELATQNISAAEEPSRPNIAQDRHDDSLLFSLDQLKSDAGDEDEEEDENSGLIDIAALTAASKSVSESRTEAAPAAAVTSRPASSGTAIRKKKSNTVPILLGLIVILALGAVIAYLLTQGGDSTDERGTENAAAGTESGQPAEGAPANTAAENTANTEDEGAADSEAAEAAQSEGEEVAAVTEQHALDSAEAMADSAVEDGEEEEADEEEEAAEPTPARELTPREAAAAQRAQEEAAARAAERAAAAEERQAAAQQAAQQPSSAPSSATATPEPAPPQANARLSNQEVVSTINRYASMIARCKRSDADAGRYPIGIVIAPSGAVTSTEGQSGQPAQCIANVARSMRFPSFNGSEMRIRYPFTLN